jgi:XRE family transcriptional regulator
MSSQDLAKKVGISNAYLSQLEHGVRLNPDSNVIMKIAKVLDLTHEESAELFDMYSKATGLISPDISEYIIKNKTVQKALRYACNKGIPNEIWEQFIEKLKK